MKAVIYLQFNFCHRKKEFGLNLEFLEIEHKFLVSETFDRKNFFKKIAKLHPRQSFDVEVMDTYFILPKLSQCVFRHRKDRTMEQLTVKSKDGGNEIRTEINLNLLKSLDQTKNVRTFLKFLDPAIKSLSINKKVEVREFSDCEIVFYEASNHVRKLYCVEFEAKDFTSAEEALEILKKYEKVTGFSEFARCNESLFEMLVEPFL